MKKINSYIWVPDNDTPRIDPFAFLGLMKIRELVLSKNSLNMNFLVSLRCIFLVDTIVGTASTLVAFFLFFFFLGFYHLNLILAPFPFFSLFCIEAVSASTNIIAIAIAIAPL